VSLGKQDRQDPLYRGPDGHAGQDNMNQCNIIAMLSVARHPIIAPNAHASIVSTMLLG